MQTKPTEIYSNTAFNTKTQTIEKFVIANEEEYPIDLVTFALSVDPLAAKYASMSPYAAFADNPILYIDEDIQTGLMEYAKANGISLTNEQAELASWYGLQGTKEYAKRFGMEGKTIKEKQAILDDNNKKTNEIIFSIEPHKEDK